MNLGLMVVLLGLAAFALVGPVSVFLARASWVSLAPRSAVLLWQAIGVGALLAGIGAGLCIAIGRYHAGFVGGNLHLIKGAFGGDPLKGLGLPDALGLTLAADLGIVLVSLIGTVMIRTVRARIRHRRLLNLLARSTPELPGTDLLDDPRAVAYCLPGRRPRIVVSSGAVRILSRDELAAVIEHERGHAEEHHGLIMLPMTGLKDLFGWIPYARLAPMKVGGLLEMAADDFAARRHSPASLAAALVQMTTSGRVPTCAMPFSSALVEQRISRLLASNRTSRKTATGTLLLAASTIAIPLTVMLFA
jgi:Zn-dependent protease with chaperone function